MTKPPYQIDSSLRKNYPAHHPQEGGGGGDSIPEPPDDGQEYVRKAGEWVATQPVHLLPFTNMLTNGGRFASTSGPFAVQLDAPFAPTSTNVLTPTNGGTSSEAGKFIHNNNDFGGTRGNMNQNTIDLINATGRTGGDARYGVEFYIHRITAGSGTGFGFEFPSGYLPLLSISNQSVIFGVGNYMTFNCWVRTHDGPLGMRAGVYLSINGVESLSGDEEIQPADGWCFVTMILHNVRGYANSSPNFYGKENLTKADFAMPSLFLGRVVIPQYAAPIPSIGGI